MTTPVRRRSLTYANLPGEPYLSHDDDGDGDKNDDGQLGRYLQVVSVFVVVAAAAAAATKTKTVTVVSQKQLLVSV